MPAEPANHWEHLGPQLLLSSTKHMLWPIRTNTPTTIQDFIFNTTGKPTNPYQMLALVMHIDRKLKTRILSKHKNKSISISEYLPLLSPYTRVYGKRRVHNKTNNTLNTKTKSKTTQILTIKKPSHLQTMEEKKPPPKTHINSYIGREGKYTKSQNKLSTNKTKLSKKLRREDHTKQIAPPT